MVLVQYAIPSAHSSNPAYLGPRSSLASPEPETSSSQYTIRQPTRPTAKEWSDLPDNDGLEEDIDEDAVFDDEDWDVSLYPDPTTDQRERAVRHSMSLGRTEEEAEALFDLKVYQNAYPDHALGQTNGEEEEDYEMEEDEGESSEEEEVEEVSPGRLSSSSRAQHDQAPSTRH